jgi:hypothetical protein
MRQSAPQPYDNLPLPAPHGPQTNSKGMQKAQTAGLGFL